MPRVVKVAPLPKYRLHVEFDDGTSGTIDLIGELDGEVFQPLRDEAVFLQVTVDEFGAVCWPNGPDLVPGAMRGELAGEPTPQSRPQWKRPTAPPARNRERAGRKPSAPAPCCVYPLFLRLYSKRSIYAC